VARSLKFQVPGSLTRRAPGVPCGSQRPNTAPAGSAHRADRPAPGMSAGGESTAPPLSPTFLAASSALSTATQVRHVAVVPVSPDGDPMAATSSPRSCPTRYRNGADSGARLSNDQPNNPP
jgi:hypothetical protein